MSTNLSKIRTNRGDIGNEIWIHLPDLSGFEKTYLSGDEAAGQTILSVLSETNFAANEFIVIGTPGTEQCEIRKISTTGTGTITVTAAITYAHNQGTLVTFIPFDQVEVYSATASGGSFSLLSAVNLRIDSLETFYPRTTDASTIYYKARFKNSQDTTYSDYSDEVAATGYAYNSVYSIKERALDQLTEKIGGLITDKFLNDSLWEARREFDAQFKRWSFRTAFNTDVANLVEGQYSFTSPTTLRNPDSPQNILAMRIGSTGRDITYFDKREFNKQYEAIIHTTVSTQPSVGQTTLVVANVRDLADSGSIKVGVDTLTYTSKTNSTNTLNGIPASGTGSITVAHAAAVDVWQNVSYGEPTRFTIYENTIFFDLPVNSDFEGDNLFMDFYRTLPEYDSDADILDEPDPDMFVSYLKVAIKNKKEKGKLNLSKDSDYQNYVVRRAKAINNEFLHQGVGFIPSVPDVDD